MDRKELLQLNLAIHGDDRPPRNDLDFFQRLPKVLLESDTLTSSHIAAAAEDLVRQTMLRLRRSGTREWDVPFRKPKVELTNFLPSHESGHIEFRDDQTVIRIHRRHVGDPFAVAAILCHEIAHFVLDHNGFRKVSRSENEKLTDLFVLACGQGIIYLQGIIDVPDEGDGWIKLGYLSLEEVAYAHVRAASQYGLAEPAIVPDHFRGKGFSSARAALKYLKTKSTSEISEIILCPKGHILRISRKRTLQSLRCPKCGWQTKMWLHKNDRSDFFVSAGKGHFDIGNYSGALESFREAQGIMKGNAEPFCWASRSLKKMGRHQDAIRELTKFLSAYPGEEIAEKEMKTLIYS